MSFFAVDPIKCTKCGICIKTCPAGIIMFGEGGLPEMPDSQVGACIKCGHCVLYCPSSANGLSFIKDKLAKSSDFKFPPQDEALDLIKTRRSVRQFKTDPVPHDVMMKILDTAKMAPSACNDQPVRWIICEHAEKTKEVRRLMFDWLKGEIFKTPTSPLAIAGASMMAKAREGSDVTLRGAPQLAIAVVPKTYAWPEDGAIALTYFELAAYALGVGTCWAGFLTMAVRSFRELREYLGIKEDEHICGAHMVGWPAMKPTRQLPPRNEQNITWF